MNSKPYRARSGELLNKPSSDLLTEIIEGDNATGFCLSCAETVEGVEPDAERYTCPHCHADKVYGAENLFMRGLYFDSDREADIQEARAAGFIK